MSFFGRLLASRSAKDEQAEFVVIFMFICREEKRKRVEREYKALSKGINPFVKRGFLIDVETGVEVMCVLRNGVFSIHPKKRSKSASKPRHIYLVLSCKLCGEGHSDFVIESLRPIQEILRFRAVNTEEQESWMDTIDKGILWERSKEAKTLTLLQAGAPMYRYQMGRAPVRRFFWLSANVHELCWTNSVHASGPNESCNKEDLREAEGIVFGPLSHGFLRASSLEHPSYFCFSILFKGRTLDLAVVGEHQISMWFLGLQSVISRIGGSGMGVQLPVLSYQSFIRRKVLYKLIETAHKFYVTVRTLLRFRVRKIAIDEAIKRDLPLPPSLAARVPSAMRNAAANSSATAENSKHLNESGDGLYDASGKLSLGPNSSSPFLNGSLPYLSPSPSVPSAVSPAADSEELLKVRGRADELSEELESANKELTSLKKKYKKLRSWASTAEVDLDALERSLEEAKSGGQILEGRITDIEYEVMQERFEEAEQARMTAEEKVDSMKKDIERLERFKSKNIRLETQLLDMDDAVAHAAGNSDAVQSKIVRELEAEVKHLSNLLANGDNKGAGDSSKLAAENAQLRVAISQLESNAATSKEIVAGLQAKIARLQDDNGSVDTYRQMSKRVGGLKDDMDVLRTQLAGGISGLLGSDWTRLQMHCELLISEHKELQLRYARVSEERKQLHNLVLELKGNIRVFARVRPLKKFEAEEEPPQGTLSYQDDNKMSVFTAKDGRKKAFEFDRVFRPNEGQKTVFDEAKPLITSALDGFNVCIMAYGQTGSGKTHTMSGTNEDPGLNLRALQELFNLKTSRQVDYSISISLAVLEIYNEEIRDLLATASNASQMKKLDVKTDGSIPGLIEKEVASPNDVLKLIDEANRNRSVAATDMNEHSSRSHAVVQVRTTCVHKGGDSPGKTFSGKLYLVDLAGSEDVGKSGVTGTALEEAKKINRSLSALGSVIGALCADNPHVPYRDSKLTMVLRDALGGDSKALLIVQTSPYQKSTVETLSSLNFASKARNVENAPARRNIH